MIDLAFWPLESLYPSPPIQSLKSQGIDKVVVLTGGRYPAREQLLVSILPHASAYRFWSGLELADRLGRECALVFSGDAGYPREERPTANVMADLARRLVPRREVLFESRSRNTAEHPLNVKPFVGSKPFVLVTSAYHMKRAIRSFERQGLRPIAYPVDRFYVGEYGWGALLPSTENLWILNMAFREYLALVLYSVKGC
jgi:uncharacterized SAM-binding protein YcdF (DUF218 family)